MGPLFALTEATTPTIVAGAQTGAPAGFDQMIGAVGMLLVLFLVVATVCEQILELFRSFLEQFDIRWLKGGVTVEQAQKLAKEFLPKDGEAAKKVDALFSDGEGLKKKISVKISDIQKIRDQIPAIVGKAAEGTPDPAAAKVLADAAAAAKVLADAAAAKVPADAAEAKVIADAAAAKVVTDAAAAKVLSDAVAAVNAAIDESEVSRILYLRVLSFLVCFGICWTSSFNAFGMVLVSYPQLLGETGATAAKATASGIFGYLATAFAAASGSNYWHDQLDRLRALKSAVGSAQKVIST